MSKFSLDKLKGKIYLDYISSVGLLCLTNLVTAFFNFNVQGEANPRLGSLYRLLDFTRRATMLKYLRF